MRRKFHRHAESLKLGRSICIFRSVILFFALFLQTAFASPQCRPSTASCAYYACAEDKLQCGEENYLTQFGAHFCEKYRSTEANFSKRGQVWLQKVRYCLQKELDRGLDSGVSCSRVEDFAFDSHVGCYVKTGYCSLGFRDKFRVVSVGSKEVFRGNFFKRIRTFQRVDAACAR